MLSCIWMPPAGALGGALCTMRFTSMESRSGTLLKELCSGGGRGPCCGRGQQTVRLAIARGRLDLTLIYNKILSDFSGLNSVALNASGDLAAVCFNDREIIVYRILEGSQKIDPSQIVNPKIGAVLEGGSLQEYRFIRLPLARYNRPPAAEVNYRPSKLAFLNDET